MTIVDTENRTIVDEVPYRTSIESAGYGEYRSGGMGIAVTPDGAWVAVAIHLNGSSGVIELYDVEQGAFVATVPVGVRPFDVVASPDSTVVYSIDHDSFTITAVDSHRRRRPRSKRHRWVTANSISRITLRCSVTARSCCRIPDACSG